MDVEKSDGDISGRYVFKNNHTLSQREYSITFNKIDVDIENGDVSSGYGSMNINNYLQYNGLESWINDSDRIEIDMNETLHNGYVSSGIGLLNIHTPPRGNKSGKLNETNMSVDNGYVNGYYCYMNSYTESNIKNHNSIEYTKKTVDISTNIYI